MRENRLVELAAGDREAVDENWRTSIDTHNEDRAMAGQDRVGWRKQTWTAAARWAGSSSRHDRFRTKFDLLYWMLFMVALCALGSAVCCQLNGNLELARPLLLLTASALGLEVIYIVLRPAGPV